jgi:hypothetical protein
VSVFLSTTSAIRLLLYDPPTNVANPVVQIWIVFVGAGVLIGMALPLGLIGLTATEVADRVQAVAQTFSAGSGARKCETAPKSRSPRKWCW